MKHPILIALFLLAAPSLFGQPDTKDLNDSAQKAKTMDSKANFASRLGALGSFAGKSGNSLTFQPTFYGIASLFNPDLKNSQNFRKEIFIRNSQLNLGVTPSQGSFLKYDSLGAGYTYAFLNNKKLTLKTYQHLMGTPEFAIMTKVQDALNMYAGAHLHDAIGDSIIERFKKGITKSDLPGLPPELKADLLRVTGAANNAELLERLGAWDALWQRTISALSRAPVLTAGFNSIYNFVGNRWQEIALTPLNLTIYMHQANPQSSALTVTGSFTFDEDTATKENFQRELIKINFGYDIIAWMTKDKKKSILEVKPGLMTSFVTRNKYVGEKTSTWDPTLGFRVRITDNFYLPVTFQYDTQNPQLLGFLAVQFSFD